MLKTISNGQSIHQYIPPDLRRMFYNNPAAVHASQNGLDPYGFSTDGLVMYLPLWALDNGGTNSIQSVDAFRHTCAITGALWTPLGRTFDGTDDNIVCGTAASISPTDAVTVEIWTRTGARDNHDTLVSRTDLAALNRGYGLENYGGAFRFFINSWDTNFATKTFAPPAGYHHYVGTYDKDAASNQINIYIDNVLGTPATYTTAINYTGAGDLTIAKGFGPVYFEAWTGEIRIYNRALSASEVAHNYNCTRWRY